MRRLWIVTMMMWGVGCEEVADLPVADTSSPLEPVAESLPPGVETEADAYDSGLDELALEQDLNFCARAPGAPTVTSTRSVTDCKQSRAITDARNAAIAATKSRCGSTQYGSLASGQCTLTGDGFVRVSPAEKCAAVDSSTVTTTQAERKSCGFWPFRHGLWTATATVSSTCGWTCATP